VVVIGVASEDIRLPKWVVDFEADKLGFLKEAKTGGSAICGAVAPCTT